MFDGVHQDDVSADLIRRSASGEVTRQIGFLFCTDAGGDVFRKLGKDGSPVIVRRSLHKFGPHDNDLLLTIKVNELGMVELRVLVDVLGEALDDCDPDDVGTKTERVVLVEGGVYRLDKEVDGVEVIVERDWHATATDDRWLPSNHSRP